MIVAGKIELGMLYALLARFGSQCYITCALLLNSFVEDCRTSAFLSRCHLGVVGIRLPC